LTNVRDWKRIDPINLEIAGIFKKKKPWSLDCFRRPGSGNPEGRGILVASGESTAMKTEFKGVFEGIG